MDIETADFGCVSIDKYREEREKIEIEHNGEDDFKNQWGLTAIRADRAYAQLELEHGTGRQPGTGQTVGLIDSGIDTGHPMFAGKTVSEQFFSGASDEDGSNRSHGTAVASIIVGDPAADFTAEVTAPRGVARGADVAMFAIPTGSGGGRYVPISLAGLNSGDNTWDSWFSHVINWGSRTIDFVNMSVGYKGIIDSYSEQDLRDNFGDSIEALAQAGVADKTVFVWAAGNAHGNPCAGSDFTGNPDLCVNRDVDGNGQVDARSVEVLAGLPARISELRGNLLSVVAVSPDSDDDDGDYEIASFSNRCGIAADWCIAAPGDGVRAAYFGPHPDNNSPGAQGAYNARGTSVAAPMVTGGLVLIKDFFRNQLSNTALVSRLLTTANKQGIYSDRSIYGQGLMDLGAATTPVGVTNVVLGDTVGGHGSVLSETRFESGEALGNGLAQSLAGHEIAAFDNLGAPFWFQLDDLAGDIPRPSMAARLRAFMAPSKTGRKFRTLWPGSAVFEAEDVIAGAPSLQVGFLQGAALGNDDGHLSLAGRALTLGKAQPDGLSIAAFSTEGLTGQSPMSGAALSWRLPESPLGFKGGFVSERETVLGSRSTGAFGRLSGGSTFVGIEGSAVIGAWRLGAGAEIGTVDATVHGGMLNRISPLITSALALRAERKLAHGDTLSFSLAQPVRIESGRVHLSVPVGRTLGGRVLRRPISADLEPTGRQVDLTAWWSHSLVGGSELRLGGNWSWQPGHDASADPDLSLLAGWRHEF